MSDELYYLQDSRDYCGNDVLWWALNGNGYTTDLSKAHVFTRAEALSQNRCRETDIPWPKDYIDGKTRPAVDMQYISINEALAGTGIVLHKAKPPKKDRHKYRCDCGKFVSEREFSERIYHGFVCRRCEERLSWIVRREARAALERWRAEHDSDGWQPIETAPTDGRHVWVRGNDWGEDSGPNHY